MMRAALAVLAVGVLAASAHAAPPAGPIRIIVPFPSGGPVDALARVLGKGLQERYGVAVVVDNRPGANGDIGIDQARRAKPDGRTLLVVPAGNLTISPNLVPALPYDVERDFAPVTLLARSPNVLVANPSLPVKSVADLIALARAKPGTLSYASPGVGSGLHLAGEIFKQQAGIDLLHVPYKGTTQAMNDVLGGQVPLMFGNYSTLAPQIRTGALRALVVTQQARSPLADTIPSMGEAGVRGVDIASWYGLLVPRATPAADVARLHDDTVELLRRPDTKRLLQEQGLEVATSSAADFAALIRQETAQMGEIIRTRHITAE